MNCISTLSQISIITNCAVLFFTSKRYRLLMCDTGLFCEDTEEEELFPDAHRLVRGWYLVDFLVFVVVIEHIGMIAKILLE